MNIQEGFFLGALIGDVFITMWLMFYCDEFIDTLMFKYKETGMSILTWVYILFSVSYSIYYIVEVV